jgi:hypothetical protein
METPPAKKRKWIGPMIMAGGAAGVLLAFGLCGTGAAFSSYTAGGVLAVAGLVVLGLGVLALLVGGILFVVELILSGSRGK